MTSSDEPKLGIAILDDYQHVALDLAEWRSLGAEQVVAFSEHFAEPHALIRALEPFTVVVAMRERTPLSADTIARLPNLRHIVTTGSQNASIDIAAARARGIAVSGTGFRPGDTAELTWGLILALSRNLPSEMAALQNGRWQDGLGVALGGRTLGVLGLGNLGRRVARVGLALEMDVVAWSENLTRTAAEEAGVRRVDRDELFAIADVLTIHLVLSDRTRGLVGSRELNAMKSSAVLVNTSRAAIVDDDALIAALRGDRIAGAALDVFRSEPLPLSHPFRNTPRLILTPHIGYVTEDIYRIFFQDAVENIAAFSRGDVLRPVEAP